MKKFLIIGLGNPGKKYALTRHNVGTMVLESIAKDLKKMFVEQQSNRVILERIGEAQYLFIKPKNYMNLSYKSVREILEFEEFDQILVVYDDIDLDLGRLKIKVGSSSTHKGVAPMIPMIPNLLHLKLGIGKELPVDRYVLGEFSKSELIEIGKVIEIAKKAIYDLSTSDIPTIQNKYNN